MSLTRSVLARFKQAFRAGRVGRLGAIASALSVAIGSAHAQVGSPGPVGTGFTYQGRLDENGAPANGVFDLQFSLFGGPSNLFFLVGSPIVLEDVPVTNGLFTVKLDFGASFPGLDRWLGVAVRPGNSAGAFTVISPRQQLTPAPYAIGLALPYSSSFNSGATPLYSMSQTGSGDLLLLNAVGGSAVDAASSGPNPTILGASAGSGPALQGQTTAGGTAIFGYALGATGRAGLFRTENTSNPDTALRVESNGTGLGLYASSRAGRAAQFENTNPNGVNGGVLTTVAGGGIPLWARTTGTSAAGRFEILNPASSANALEASTTGTGLAGKFTGPVQVQGELHATTGTVLNRATPIAWGTFTASGNPTFITSSGNVSVSLSGSIYRVTVVGESDPANWTTVATIVYDTASNIVGEYVVRTGRAQSVLLNPNAGVVSFSQRCIDGCQEFQTGHSIAFVIYKGQ